MLSCAAGQGAAQAQPPVELRWVIEGYVVHVADGDSVNILDTRHREHRVRLDGIDAPEREQPHGAASRRHLYDLTYGLDVVATCRKVDQDGRDLCQLTVGGTDAALAQLRSGLAWFLVRYADELPEAQRGTYAAAHEQAQRERAGLWAAAVAPVPPWEWRRGGRR